MRGNTRIIAKLMGFGLSGVCVQAALYWDSNGTAAGAGTMPNGTWGTDAFWNATADGTTTFPVAWVPGQDAVFSAGTDATDSFTVGLTGAQTAGNLTVEEGTITFSGDTALNVGGAAVGKGIINIASGLTTTISTELTGGDDTGQITKAGDGTLIVNASCTHTGVTTIAGGTLKLGASELLNHVSDLFIGDTGVFDMNDFDQTIDGLFGAGTIVNPGGGILRVGHNNRAAAAFSGTIGTPSDNSPITLIKVGTGTQTLANFSAYSGPTIVSEGVLAISDGDALGTYESPTVVSNGAALHLTRSTSYGEPVVLNGEGFSGASGALRNISGTGWNGGVVLGSNARVNNEAGGTWTWLLGTPPNYNVGVDGIIAGGVFSVTFGGNGGTTQLKNSYRAVILNNAPIYKDGSSLLRFETPCVGVSAFYLNGGYVMTRTANKYNFIPPTSPIYVGAAAGGFDTGLNASPNPDLSLVLAAGANPVFIVRPSQGGTPQSWKQDGVISGLGGLSKTNEGTLFLNRHNTYSGNTTIQSGPLALGAGGSISNSAAIDVQSADSVFNVTSNANGFVLGPAQTLKGNGTVWGDVTVNGTISPGDSIGHITFSNNLTLAADAKLLIEVDKALPTNDVITVSGTLNSTGTGTVTVTNVNPGTPLAPGDSFQIFSQPVVNGQALAVSGAGMIWSNKLAIDGSIAVVSVAPPPVAQVPRMTFLTVGGPVGVKVTWTNVTVGSNYWLQYSTNLNTSNWTELNPVTASGTTTFQMDGVPIGERQRYYRVRFLTPGGVPPATIPRITSVTFPGTTVVTVNYTNTLVGTNYVVQYRTNLNTTNWASLNPVSASGTASATTDSFPVGRSQRYYRVYYVAQ